MISRSKITAAIISPDTRIIDAVNSIETGMIQAALVADGAGRLLGVTTDGDIRRGILRGIPLDAPVSSVMNSKPAVLGLSAVRGEALALMSSLRIRQVPVVDADHLIAGVHHVDTPGESSDQSGNWAVIMVGGLGTRLHPLTQTTPKPMLPIGGRPLLEIIISNLVAQGFVRVYLSVHYMAEVFKEHFGDGTGFGVDIRYVEETTRLGTAGALALLPERPPGPFVVMNGDLLTSVSFRSLVDYHHETRGPCTMCVRDYRIQIPYGVVETAGGYVSCISEKPFKSFFVNAGIYVIEPSLLDRLKPGQRLDMTTLIENVIADGGGVSSFPIHEYWMDIGQADDLQRARDEFAGVFRH